MRYVIKRAAQGWIVYGGAGVWGTVPLGRFYTRWGARRHVRRCVRVDNTAPEVVET